MARTSHDGSASNPPPDIQSVGHTENSFLLILAVHDFTRHPPLDECTVVYTNGKYYYESLSEQRDRTVTAKVADGLLPDQELAILREILAADDLLNLNHVAHALPGEEAQITQLAVPRSDHVQKFVFADYYHVVTPSGLTQHNVPDDKEYVLKPLRNWMKGHIQTDNAKIVANANPTFCRINP
jgi:hypothetical protein